MERSEPYRTKFVSGLKLEGQMYRALGELFEQYDALIYPTSGTRGCVHRGGLRGHETVMNVVELEHYLLGQLTLPFNLFSRSRCFHTHRFR